MVPAERDQRKLLGGPFNGDPDLWPYKRGVWLALDGGCTAYYVRTGRRGPELIYQGTRSTHGERENNDIRQNR